MDKKSNRTDLLAAGRKKLQQYRQKKDNKGKDGKGRDSKGGASGSSRSTNKADKSEHNDADANAAMKVAEPSMLPQGEVESTPSLPDPVGNVVDSTIDAQNVLENSAATSTDSQNVDQIATSASLDVAEQVPVMDPVLVQSSSWNLKTDTLNEEVELKPHLLEVEGVASSGSTEIETVNEDVFTPTPAGAVYSSEPDAALPVEVEGAHGADQVSVVGAMQEADNFGPKHFDQSVQQDLDGDSRLSMPAYHEGCETPAASNDISAKLASREPDRKPDVSDVAIIACDEGHETMEASVPVETANVTAESRTGSSHKLNQPHEDRMDGSCTESEVHVHSMSNDSRCYKNEADPADLERRDDKGSDEHCLHENKIVDSVQEQPVCVGLQGNSISLHQLAELLKQLPEGDFRYLIKSREMVGHREDVVLRDCTIDVPERFQEHLYLSNISKDFFHLQLQEQHEQQADVDHQHGSLVGEVPAITPSLSVVQEVDNSVAMELSQCKLELEAAMRERVELHSLYQSAKEDVMIYSAKVDELRIKLEETVGHLSSLSADLVSCKVLLEASQDENEKLSEGLASVTDQRNEFEVAMEQYVHENRKLSGDLADSGMQLAALQQEIGSLKRSLASVEDEREKFEEEKEILIREKETLLGDLSDCKSAMGALQQDYAGVNMNLATVTEEHNKLKEHEVFLTQETERLSAELVAVQDKMSVQHQEHVQLQADLQETMTRLEQLAEENIILQSNLEIHKAKLAEVDSQQIQLSLVVGSVSSEAKSHSGAADIDSSIRISKEEDEYMVSSVGPASDDTSQSTALRQSGLDLHDDTSTAVRLKGYLEEAEKMIQVIEKLMDGMHFQSTSLSPLAGKGAAPGVSKLIQAFESKANIDDHDSSESLLPSDPYSSAKEQISHLRAVLKALTQNVDHAQAVIMEEKDGRKADIVACRELEVEIEALKGFNNNLEMRNIELEVLCGAMNQHVLDIEVKKTRLEDLFEALQIQEAGLQSQNIELLKKLNVFQSRITGFEVQLNGVRSSSDVVASVICDEVTTMQREIREDIYAVHRRWKAAVAKLVPYVEKLDAVVGSASSHPDHGETHNDGDILGRFSFSVTAACEVIEQLKIRHEAASRDHEALSHSFTELKEKLSGLGDERDSAIGLLSKVSGDLVKLLSLSLELVEDGDIQSREVIQCDPLDGSHYEALVSKLRSLLGEMVQLKDIHSKLYSELLNRTNEIEELKKACLNGDSLVKISMDVKEVLKLQDTEVDFGEAPASHLQSSVLLLIQRYKEAEGRASLLDNDLKSRMTDFGELQGRVEVLDSINFQQQNEILVLRESLTHAKDTFDAIHVELLEKTRELEQSEQRVSSVREKLSIAVAKGKGLVVQRDTLKQSLAEMSGELEKCTQELRLKDSRLYEVEEKLKAYSEAGERMEALESELSYIRNSATALRESFLLKDSVLQRIEEILEDLELPDHFHSKDIIQKVDWLAKSVASNSLPPADWDQRSSVGGGSYSDAGLVMTDGSKEDVPPTSNPVDDLRRKYDELQTKFYELAEQNDMLEQSLMERNILVQRWEEILDRINTPPQIRSMEPEERIHWLGTALSEADHHMRSLQQKVETLENYCGSLSGDLEESQRRMAEHESTLHTLLHEKESALSDAEDQLKSLQQRIGNLDDHCGSLSSALEESQRRISEHEYSLREVLHEKDILSSNLVTMTTDCEIALNTVAQYEQEINRLKEDVDMLQEKLVENLGNKDHIDQIESELKRLQHFILDVLQVSETEDVSSDESNIQHLERLIRLLRNHINGVRAESHGLREVVDNDVSDETAEARIVTETENEHLSDANQDEPNMRSTISEEQVVTDLRRQLAEALDEVVHLREEKDAYMQKSQSLASEVEALESNMKEFQELLKQEEQKSASLREKLNLAVRKGKSLVRQRDSLKQNMEDMTSEIDRLKSEINSQEQSLLDSVQKINDLSFQMETYKAFETENMSLKTRLIEAEQHLQQNGHTLSMVLNKLSDVDTGGEISSHDPLQKLEEIGKLCADLHAAATSSEKEANKSKKAAELLVAELNEVQERNDVLQEEVSRAYDEMSRLSRERELADSAKVEALSHLAILSEERRKHLAEFERLNTCVLELKKGFIEINTVTGDVFAKDIQLLLSVRTHMESCLGQIGMNFVATKDYVVSEDIRSTHSLWDNVLPDQLAEDVGFEQYLQRLLEAFGAFKQRVNSHSMSFNKEAEHFNNVINTVLMEITSRRDSLESIKGDCIRLESTLKEKDMEGVVMHRSISLLCEACTSSVIEIENRKSQLLGDNFSDGDLRINLPSLPSTDGPYFCGVNLSASEDCVKTLADRLLLAVNNFVNVQMESVEGHSKEMRSTILNLQKELQEKDIQRERISMELVSQIKEAEATAARYSRDLQSFKNYVQELESKLEAMGTERNLLEQRVAELQQEHVSSLESREKVNSLTSLLTAKEHEIEALMQALDEEENQMEALRNKIEVLHKEVEQKNIDLEHNEASRAKAVKKLSVTVSKFDELHQMSEGLLSEIENLQSQLQDRDAEISFLRQEVTRCTNDVLEATRKAKERTSGELHEFLTWLDTMFSHVLMHDAHGGDENATHDHEYKENLQKDITSIISELEDLRVATQRKDTLLQAERNKVEELSRSMEALEVSLQEKDIHLSSLQDVGDSGLGTSEIVEVEPALNKWTAPVTSSASQVRSLRKVNNEQVSIAIDQDAGSSDRFEDEDDDKVHGFRSLTTSRFVPKFTRPVGDMIDGLWVSCDRTLMRQPAFRLGIMIYWALLHALLASFIV